jgi:hypothetical protein
LTPSPEEFAVMRWKLAAAALVAAGVAAMPLAPASAWDGRYRHYYGHGYGCCYFPFGLVGAAAATAAAIVSAPFVIASAPFRQPYYPPPYPYPAPGYYAPAPGYYAPPPGYYPPPGYQYAPSEMPK